MLLADLDVVLDPESRALVDDLLQPAIRPTPDRALETATLTRDGRWWEVALGGTSTRVPDTKGMRYVAELVARPGVERHVLDLVDRVEGVSDVGLDRRHLGDAGPALDGRARAAYRHEIERLRSEIDDALAADLFETAEGLQQDLESLVGQLAGAFGLGGRDRRAASAAEKARLNVTRAIRTAVRTLRAALPAAGAILDRGIHTGRFCVYQAAEGDQIRWIVHP